MIRIQINSISSSNQNQNIPLFYINKIILFKEVQLVKTNKEMSIKITKDLTIIQSKSIK